MSQSPASMTVRFAPSPTGLIHIGNARTALFNALLALNSGGDFILRLDDTDQERSTEAFARQIEEDIRWLGIRPSRTERQSARLARYDAVVEDLKACGRLYACYETPDELERKRARQRARGKPPVYDRAALRLTDAEKADLEVQGRRPHWRFKLANFGDDPFSPVATPVVWDDLCRGRQTVDLASVSDPVLIREDGSYLYTLCSVIDDIDMGVSHVVRGEDHVTNAGVQVDIFRALGAEPPVFGHHNLLTLASGEALSKRTGALSISALREAGYEAAAVASLAVLIGTSAPVEPYADLMALAEAFDLSTVSRAPARFDPDDIRRLNARLLHELPFEAVSDRIAIPRDADARAYWEAIRGNIEIAGDAEVWRHVVEGPLEPILDPDASAVLDAARRLLPEETFDGGTWSRWTGAIKAETGARGRALFRPLRLALTARENGPELAALLPLIGRRKAACRLAGQAA